MGRAVLALALCCGGCNAIFGLDPTSLGDDDDDDGGVIDGSNECVPVGHDEDADGIDDACDFCPHIGGNGGGTQADADGDRVGDACDPHAGSPDRIVIFAPLDGPDIDWTPYRGTWTLDADGLHQTDVNNASTFAVLGYEVIGSMVADVGVRIDGMLGTGAHAFSIWVDATVVDISGQPDGYAAGIYHPGGTNPPVVSLAMWSGQNQYPFGTSPLAATYVAGDRFRIRAAREPEQLDETGTFLATGTSGVVNSFDTMYQQGLIGFATGVTAITVEYVVVIQPHF